MSEDILFKTESLADFSPCRNYRYTLKRRWNKSLPYAAFIGLNPSTADETTDDPTIRRCVGFAKSWGYGGLMMLNLFAYRAAKPADMIAQADPVGPENDDYIWRMADGAAITVAAWGAHGTLKNRAGKVRAMVRNLHYLQLTKAGEPGHPLYLKRDLTPRLWEAAK